MTFPSNEQRRTGFSVHSWTGLIMGGLLFAIALTGSLSVVREDIAAWSSSTRVDSGPFPLPLESVLLDVRSGLPEELRANIDVGRSTEGKVYAFFNQSYETDDGGWSRKGIEYRIDPASGAIVSTAEGTEEEIVDERASDALARFFVDLHVKLHVPDPYGLFLTGLLGLSILIASLTGLIATTRMAKDLIGGRRSQSRIVVARDRHATIGLWTVPFALLLAFTGSFFSFSDSIGLPVIAKIAFRGDEKAMNDRIFGTARAPGTASPAIIGIDDAINDAERRTGAPASFLSISNLGLSTGEIVVSMAPAVGDIVPKSWRYSTATGQFIGESAIIGTRPSLGGTIVGGIAELHFGRFGGIASRLVWVAMGLTVAWISLAGLRLWIVRRGERTNLLARRGYAWLSRGLPLALAAAAIGYFAALNTAIAPDRMMMMPFLTVLLGSLAFAMLAPLSFMEDTLRILHGLTLGLLPAIRYLTGGQGWLEAAAEGNGAIILIDLVLIAYAFAVLRRSTPVDVPAADSAAMARAQPGFNA